MDFIDRAIVNCYDAYGHKFGTEEQDVLKHWQTDITHLKSFHDVIHTPYVVSDIQQDDCGWEYCDPRFKNGTCEGHFVSVKHAISNDGARTAIELSPRRCFKGGYCYMNLFIGLGEHVPDELRATFVQFLDLCPAIVGPWPTGATLARVIEYLTNRIPSVRGLVIPNVSVSHSDKQAHVADQRGPPVGWHILTTATLGDLHVACMNSELREYKFGASITEAYEHLKRSIKFANGTANPCVTFNRMVMMDAALAATLLLSPATLSRMQDWFSTDNNATNLLMAVEASGADALTRIQILDRARKGITIHFSGTDFEKAVVEYHQQILDYLTTFDNVDDLRRATTRLHTLIAGAEKNHFLLLEKRILGLSEYHFQKECGIGFFCRSAYWFTSALASFITGGGKFQWTDAFRRHALKMFLAFYWYSVILLNAGYHMAYWWAGWFTLKNLVLTSGKLWLNYSFGRQYQHHIWMCAVSCFTMIMTLYISMKQLKLLEKGTTLQSDDKTKRVTGLIALVILIIHLFDCDLALRLSSSFNSVVRLSSYLTEETRNLLPRILGTTLQGISEEEEELVQEISLEMDPEEVQAHDLKHHRETFGAWIDGKVLSSEIYTRELQYGGKDVNYMLTNKNQAEVASEMVDTKRQWNSLFGATGSGKSTRLPVLYLEALRCKAGRKKRILICEPSRATTVNVASGISEFYGQQVYYKHGDGEQVGDLSIQVMTYGSAFMRSVRQKDFLHTFDAVFLDESHCVQAHNLAFEALLDKFELVRKFYMSATPRVGAIDYNAVRRFHVEKVNVENVDPYYWFRQQGTGDRYDVLSKGNVILVFLSGRHECDKLADKTTSSGGAFAEFKGISLHSFNFQKNYNKIITMSNNEEKVIVYCTNILETGVTLNADVVVDFGFTMRPMLDLSIKTLSLSKQRATDFERHQRIGRVGRVKDGFALLCGKTVGSRPTVPPDVVYEAALYSFLYDLDLYANETLDTSWLCSITREQAQTMLSFSIPIFILKDLVSVDGCVRPEACKFLKKFMLNDMELRTREFSVANHTYSTWPTAHDMLMRCYKGDEMNDEMRKLCSEKVSFATFSFDENQICEFVDVCKAYRPRFSLQHSNHKVVRKVLMKVSPETVNQCHIVAVALRARLQSMLNSLVCIQSKVKDSTLVQCLGFAKRMNQDQARRIEVLKGNISEVEKHIQALQQYDTYIHYGDDLDSFIESEDFQNVTQHITLQVDGENTEASVASMLGIKCDDAITLKDVMAARGDKIAFAFLALSGAYLVSEIYARMHRFLGASHNGTFTLEGKGKRYDRSKRSEAAAVNEAFDMFTKVRKEKGMKQREKPRLSVVSSLLKKTNPFVNFYDLGGDENVEHAVFKTLEGVVLHETDKPCEDVKILDRIISSPDLSVPVGNWADEEVDLPKQIQCEVKLKDGRTVVTNLEPHNCKTVTRTAGLVGYHEHDGEYRQVGATKLEMASTIPFSKVDAGTSSMLGIVSSKGEPRMNAILYGDFIIMPAHVQTLTLPLSIRFQHVSFTYEGGEVMRFKQCDLILVKRPNIVAPMKVMAKAGVLKEQQAVQLFYRVPGTFKAVVSASDICTPFENGRWTYSISTKNGMCGAAVVCVRTGQLVGIHVAANETLRRNFMEPFSEDMVDVLQKRQPFSGDSDWLFSKEECGYVPGELSDLQGYIWDIEFDPTRYSTQLLEWNADGFGEGIPHSAIKDSNGEITFTLSNGGFESIAASHSHLCSKHKISGESPYWKQFKLENQKLVEGIEEYEDHYAPSALNRQAYYKDVGKYDRQLCCRPDLKRLEQARKMVQCDLERAGLVSTRRMSAHEVLADLEVNTAAGALYACKKKVLFTGWDDEKLLRFTNKCFTALCSGTSMGVWNGSLKDELRPVEKVLENKTRVFTAAPVTSLLGGKFVVDDFNKKFYATNCNARHTVGINPWAGGWERLAEFLGGCGMPYYISGDGSRFDSSLDPILFDQVLKMRLHFFDKSDQMARQALRNLYQEIIFTPILLENGQIVMKKVGNPSGQPSTVVDNTLILMMCFYYCALAITDDGEWIRKNFLFVCNGDDQKCAMTQAFIDKGGLNFHEQLAQCGLNYEFDEITNDITEYPYMSLTMVKREFGKRSRIGFILNPERIVAINQWANKKGVLGACQRAFPAMLHSYNDPWLFSIMHAYLVWLLMSFEDELLWAMKQTGESVAYLSPEFVHLLHFGGTQLQVDPETDRPRAQPTPEGSGGRALVQWTVPQVKQTPKIMGFRLVGGKQRATGELIKSIPSGVREIFRNDIATDGQFVRWETDVKSDYDITSDGEWNTVLMAWCIYCANNGASEKMDPHDVMALPTGRAEHNEIQIAGFLRAAQPIGLRKIMRKLSRQTSAALKQLGEMTKWGLQRGICEARMIPYAFDFYVFDEMTPKWAREQLTSVKHSALGIGKRNAVILDSKHHSVETTNDPQNEQFAGRFKAPTI